MEADRKVHPRDAFWDVIIKLSAVVVLACSGALIRNEIVDGNQTTRLEFLEKRDAIPKWLADSTKRIENAVTAMEGAIQGLRSVVEKSVGRLEALEAKGRDK